MDPTTSTTLSTPTLPQNTGQGIDNLVSGVSGFFSSLSPAFFFAILGMAIVLAFFVYYWCCLRPRPNSLEWVSMAEMKFRRKSMRLTLPHHPMERCDLLPMLLVTSAYAFTAFLHLGSLSAPEHYVKFQQGDTYTFSFAQPVQVDKISFYTSLGTGTYQLEYSSDGSHWQPAANLEQSYDTLFKWVSVDVTQPPEMQDGFAAPMQATSFRITAIDAPREEGLWLTELVLWDGNQPLKPDFMDVGVQSLFDEPEEWTAKATDQNSAYFDEIYHARTAFEHLNGLSPYEVSHPPLGKLILSTGIALFGMVPFGWRFMGALFGVLMLPILYVFLKNLFGKTPVALCGTCLFAFDFMHLVQTRIATIDTYGVFFILLSYYFMYRWLTKPVGSRLRSTALPLFLSGLFWGIGCACKWTVIYAGAGLAVLWVLGLFFRYREWKRCPDGYDYVSFVLSTTSLSVIFFVLIPVAIYTLSYIPYVTAQGSWTLDSLLDTMWENQVFMFNYHKGVHTPHPYSSDWYQWVLDARPILYYRDLDLSATHGVKSLFASFNNPLVSWAGLLAFFGVLIQTVRRSCGKGLFILIAILSQLLPWLPIGRTLFAYHYFPTILFLVFAIAYLMNDILDRHRPGASLAVYGFTSSVVVVYALFYPVLTGLYIPLWYSDFFLRWFPSWPL